MLFEKLLSNLVSLILILLFGIKLIGKKSFQNAETKYFWLTLISCLLLVFEDALEASASEDPSLLYWRILLSVLGYTFRATASLGLLLVILPRKSRSFLWWIPSLITFLVNCTAFFSRIAFYFNEEYAYRRGPLGIVSFIVPLFYILVILIQSFRSISERNGSGKYIVPACILCCVAATVKGVFIGGNELTAAIMISSIFFYMALYSHDNRLDTLTGLFNRQAYYDDCAALGKNVKAVASLDMNGLKGLNDTLGHQAGDKALKAIGRCLQACTGGSLSAYRIGGDEFAVLFFRGNEEEIASFEKEIKEKVAAAGYSVSVGYALRGKEGGLDETVAESDRLMYEDKARYYQTTGIERRRSPAP